MEASAAGFGVPLDGGEMDTRGGGPGRCFSPPAAPAKPARSTTYFRRPRTRFKNLVVYVYSRSGIGPPSVYKRHKSTTSLDSRPGFYL